MIISGVTIEMSLSKDQTLTVVVTGKEEQVKKARREVMTKLQTQVQASCFKCIVVTFVFCCMSLILLKVL